MSRFWKRIGKVAFLLTAAFSVGACADDSTCDPGLPGVDIASPDGEHIARIHKGFCGFPGAYEKWSVGVRRRWDGIKNEKVVFVTFDDQPGLSWADDRQLVIEVRGVTEIDRSEREAKGVSIQYRLHASLTEARIRAQLQDEQQRTIEFSGAGGLAPRMSENAKQRYEAFLSWAANYADLSRSTP